MLEINNYLSSEIPTNVSQQNTVVLSIKACTSSTITIEEIKNHLQVLGVPSKSIDFIATKSLTSKSFNYSLNAAVLLLSPLSRHTLNLMLKKIENKLKLINLEILTYNRTIIGGQDVIEVPFLYDFIKQVQPEIFSW